jgi:hypothetical protein
MIHIFATLIISAVALIAVWQWARIQFDSWRNRRLIRRTLNELRVWRQEHDAKKEST